MPVTPTFPGVYIEEIPSGVRTIVGVATSIGLFVGRARQGPLNQPVLCLNFSDFERAFSSDYARSDLARSVRLFFQNGGSQCYVVRIASGATQSTVTLENTAGNPVLVATSKSAGAVGDTMRLAVTYSGPRPEATFNLEVFRWTQTPQGVQVKADRELYQNLDMDPLSPRYAPDYVTQNSALITLAAQGGLTPAANGFSQSGRAVPARTNAIFQTQWKALIGTTSTPNRFRISVDGGAFTEVDLSTLDFTQAPLSTVANIATSLGTAIKQLIEAKIQSGAQVSVSFPNGPAGTAGQDNEQTVTMRIASANGDVLIQPASVNDTAIALLLGTDQGGIEVGRFAQNRPAPTGTVFNPGNNLVNLVNFMAQKQTAFNTINVAGTAIALAGFQTVVGPEARMYQDGFTTAVTGNSDGVREKLSMIVAAVNAQQAADPTFKWSAEAWGDRLALLPGAGGDNSQGAVTTSGGDGVNIATSFTPNVRYYSLGPSGTGTWQVPAGAPASDGSAPAMSDYRAAYGVVDSQVDLFNLLVLPSDEDHLPATRASLWGPASDFCVKRRAFLMMDAPAEWKTVTQATAGITALRVGLAKDHAAIYHPRIVINENGRITSVGAGGAIAGLMSRIDGSRGVWKAPAGMEADLRGIVDVDIKYSNDENGILNPRAINTIRSFPAGVVSWGARTMDGDDGFGSEYRYVPIRRLALFIEESLYRGTQWVVFEPNDEPLWSQIRLNVGAFMHNLFRQGAFEGKTPLQAYFVKCDGETTTANDRNLGIVNILVGFAPLKPAEFVIIQIQQIAGQIQT